MNVFAATSMVAAPSAVGVNVAVYTVLEDAVKLLKAPFVTVISPTTKLLVALLLVNVSESVASLDVNPSTPSAAVIVMVGAALLAKEDSYQATVLSLDDAEITS